MHRVYVSIGSNIDHDVHIHSVLATLNDSFGPLTVSTVYESEAVGFDGDNFYNLVIAFDTDLGLQTLLDTLHEIERLHGRKRGSDHFSPRTLDLDILLYDDCVEKNDRLQIPRDEITRYAFVLCPLAEIAGDQHHPITGQQYKDMWEGFDKSSQKIWPAEFSWP